MKKGKLNMASDLFLIETKIFLFLITQILILHIQQIFHKRIYKLEVNNLS
jgi:hypothetical protein